ncbi:MAG: ATP-binding protein [Deferrisomatales bacterium]
MNLARLPLGPLHPWARWARARLRGRPDSEHEQAAIRVAVGCLAWAYYLPASWGDSRLAPGEVHTLWLGALFLAASVAILGWIVADPGARPGRRIAGMVLDLGATAMCLYLNGDQAAPFFPVLLWVTLGNGFRYGQRYLLAATVVSATAFGVVGLTNGFWRGQPSLTAGLLFGLVVLPAYASSLLRKLTDAVARAREASRAKGQFLANMSHEVRTPLNGIIGMADLLADTPLTQEQSEFAQTIRASAQTLLSLVDNVLDFSKVEAGKLEPRETDLDFHALLRGAVAMFAPQAEAKGVRLSSLLDPRVPYALRGDPVYLRQIVINLLSNAIKFTERGEVILSARLEADGPDAATVRVEVADTGIGIPAEARARIFEPFTQADASITRRYGGTGLGTAIAKQLVELMGGRIGLESRLGEGSTFWFRLSLAKQHRDDPTAEVDRCPPPQGSRALLLSAQPAALEAVGHWLGGWGFHCSSAQNTAQAFARLVAGAHGGTPYGVVLVADQGLDLGAGEFAAAVRADPAIRHAQLILLPADEAADPTAAARHGYASVVTPPVEKTAVFNAVHYARAEEGPGVGDGVIRLPARPLRAEPPRRLGLRVLVAEDNPVNQRVIRKILERAGHSVRIAQDGEQALEVLEGQEVDVAVLDVHMPAMSGVDVARACRFMEAPGRRVPLVALTADTLAAAEQACRRAGFDAFLTKPVEAPKLLEVVESLAVRPAAERTSGEPLAPWAPSHRPGGRPAVLDDEILRGLQDLDRNSGFVPELVEVFLADGEQALRGLARAGAAGDREGVRDLVHALKSSAGTIGALALQEACVELDRAARGTLGEEHHALLEGVREQFGRAREALKAHPLAARRAAAL